MEPSELSEKAKNCRNAYKRAWGKKNRDKVRIHNKNYWERRAEKEANSKTTK
jgi:hypothetical protein